MSKITDLTKFRQAKLLLNRVEEQTPYVPTSIEDNVAFIISKLRRLKTVLDPMHRRDLTAIEIIVEDISADLKLRPPKPYS